MTYGEDMERTVACTNCTSLEHPVLDQVIELAAVTICQCACGEIAVIVKAATPRRVEST
jgi:hypothetical protein